MKKPEYMDILKRQFPRRRNETLESIYKRFRTRINNWKKQYNIPQDTLDLVLESLLKFNIRCKYCNDPLTFENVSLDHKTPRHRQGSVNNLDNLQLICKRCNVRKGQLTHDEYCKLLEVVNVFDISAKRYVLRKLSMMDFGGV